ncbi:hypothetical protein QJS04_geneDACA014129 [Acorus gramineus]|uniref:Uncharacterized protein n=1 Tax=Acorus gramineus TaxID=55184 RepID=A0AAV9B787_ACOGR|nr:hypothetical protein QJS04_geneDACA014129 [Acorus gramineus]
MSLSDASISGRHGSKKEKGPDRDWVTWSQEYSGYHTYSNRPKPTDPAYRVDLQGHDFLGLK